MVSATPYENTEVKQLNYTNNPITITFDTQLSLNEEAIGYLYKDDETTPDGTLRLGVTDNKLYVFPVTARNLFKGHNYKVTVPRNAVYDIMGNNGNDSITLHYIGGFEREVSYDNDTLFVEDFNNGFTKTMLYEGDHNKPTEEMQKWISTIAITILGPWYAMKMIPITMPLLPLRCMTPSGGLTTGWSQRISISRTTDVICNLMPKVSGRIKR